MRNVFLAALLVFSAFSTEAAFAQSGYPTRYNFGTTPTPDELSRFFSVPPDGAGLPQGRGTVAQGATIYASRCAGCHGTNMQGALEVYGGGGPLVGGRGTLQSAQPIKTVESYWPYATTIFDYVKRTMPQDAPGSLTDDETYSLVAFILFSANIVGKDKVLDAADLPKIAMPNQKGFMIDKNLETANYR
jgi:mono/diheme cytochrome c family protein